ncbi:MAG: hypothetical protein AABW89_00460 [Nanoarchaeota archaeon]
MKKIELLRVLEKYPLFTFNEFVKITGKSIKYSRTYIYRLKKDKLIFEIEKGKYTLKDNPLIFASFITAPSYISFWTALRFYNVTDQLPNEIMVASKRSKKEITFLNAKIKFYKVKYLWGYRKIRYNNFDIFIAELEKSIIDSVASGLVPLSEIVDVLINEEINTLKLKEFAIKTGSKSLIKRIGFLLDKIKVDADEMLKYIDYNYIILDINNKSKGDKNKKWRIIDNLSYDFT